MTSTPLPEKGGFNERVKEELVKQRRLVEDGFYSRIVADEKLAETIRTLVLEEIIGEDDDVFMKINPASDEDLLITLGENANNRLRAEQRKKLGGHS